MKKFLALVLCLTLVLTCFTALLGCGGNESGDTQSGNSVSDNTDSGDTQSGNSVSDNTDSGDTQSGNSVSDNTDSGSGENNKNEILRKSIYGTAYDNAQKFLTTEYLDGNKTKQPSANDNLPYDIVNVVNNRNVFDNIFANYLCDIRFDAETFILYFFTDIYAGFSVFFDGAEIVEGKLIVTLFHDLADEDENGLRPPSTSLPTQRCVAIKVSCAWAGDAVVVMEYE